MSNICCQGMKREGRVRCLFWVSISWILFGKDCYRTEPGTYVTALASHRKQRKDIMGLLIKWKIPSISKQIRHCLTIYGIWLRSSTNFS